MEPVLHRRARRRTITLCIAFVVAALALASVPMHAMAKGRGKRYVLPVAEKWAGKHRLDNRHHDYPAWDLPVPKWTPVRSVTQGRVSGVTRWGGCGNGVIIKGRDGYEYTYCHGARVTIKRRAKVHPGELIMLSGSSGHSTGPHLHLQIQGPNGRLLCPQPLVERWSRGIQVSPRGTSPRGCAYSPDRTIYRPASNPHGRRGGGSQGRRGPAAIRAHGSKPGRGPARGRGNGGRGDAGKASKSGKPHETRGRSRSASSRQRDRRPAKERRIDRKDRSRNSDDRGKKRGFLEVRRRVRNRFHQRLKRARRLGYGGLQRRLERRFERRTRQLDRRAERRRERLQAQAEAARRAELALERRVHPVI